MNKTIIININGLVFHIEEDAYDVLRSYMIDVKKHFAYTADSQEIVSDIENRIAEMFNERLEPGKKEVIGLTDVQEVCAQMGSVNDFETPDPSASYDEERIDPENYHTTTRKLFRDPDDKVFGGVCSGLGYYLDIDVRWIRLAMVLLFIFAGTGLLLYVIMWIIVPLARTRADRMAMKGEMPNLHNFKRNFDEEMEGVRRNFTAAGEGVDPGLNKRNDALENLVSVLGNIIVIGLKVVAILIIAGLCIGLASCAVVFVGMAFSIDRFSWPGMEELTNLLPAESVRGALIAGFLVMALPIVALIALLIRMLSNRRIIGNYLGLSMLIIWLIALGSVAYFTADVAGNFSEEATVVEEEPLENYPVYYLNMHDVNEVRRTGPDARGRSSRYTRRRAHQGIRHTAALYIEKADSTMGPRIVEEYRAKGASFEEAVRHAENTTYNIQRDSSRLVFDTRLLLPEGESFREQDVRIKLYIPLGARVFISRDADRFIRDLPVWECRESYPEEAVPEMSEWVMTEYGLRCLELQKKKDKDDDVDDAQPEGESSGDTDD